MQLNVFADEYTWSTGNKITALKKLETQKSGTHGVLLFNRHEY